MIMNGTPAPQLVGADWRKSSFSNSKGNCVEFARVAPGQVGVRNSRHPSGPALVFGTGDLATFVTAAKAGTYDDLLLPA